uniref:(northern house mosquito) hypothetical protein n=1 Tax=Culex pipiens TaxID=7175 RepID=A0A8D8GA83_CULPI
MSCSAPVRLSPAAVRRTRSRCKSHSGASPPSGQTGPWANLPRLHLVWVPLSFHRWPVRSCRCCCRSREWFRWLLNQPLVEILLSLPLSWGHRRSECNYQLRMPPSSSPPR